MIKQIVFDIGNVLVHYAPDEFTRHFVKDEALANEICRLVFKGPEWPMLDRGTLTRDQALGRILERSAAHGELKAHTGLIREVYSGWVGLLKPVEGTVKLLWELKQAGYKLYYLSNYAHEPFEDTRARLSFFEAFDGGVASYELHINKPEPGIYDALIRKYKLNPSECLFIDDMPENVRGAQDAGMKAVWFENPEKLRESLAGFGVDPQAAFV